MRRLALAALVALVGLGACSARPRAVVVGSKKFTESVILGELGAAIVRASGIPARHRAELGGTRILWSALQGHDIDAYPEYTGTLCEEILRDPRRECAEPPTLRKLLAARGIGMTDPLGFNNTYAIGMREEFAGKLHIETLSDLVRHPELVLGLSNEFLSRADGWPGLRRRYGLPQADVRGMDHDFAYRALESGDVQAVDLYSTDPEIRYYHLRVLKDDLAYFPRYQAVFLYRADLAPAAANALARLAGELDAERMIGLNARAKLEREPEARVARDFLRERLHVEAPEERGAGLWERIGTRGLEHLGLVGRSLAAALLVALPLGALSARRPRWGGFIVGAIGAIQTLPALAVLVLLIRPLKLLGLPGIGDTPACVALFLYSLLPIVRNTMAGLRGVAPELLESAEAMGLTPAARFRLIELPLAAPMILAGIQTAAVTNVGFATLGALVGSGGFGQPILTGIRLDDYPLILEGAVPAALLALAVQGGFGTLGRIVFRRR